MSLTCISAYPDLDIFDEEINCRGNGKTCTLTYYLKKDNEKGKKILTNYTTTFSEKMTTKQILDIIFDKNMNNVSIGLDEFQEFLGSLGEKKDKVKYTRRLVNQSRKKSIDIYYCVPTFKDGHIRMRDVVNYNLKPEKHHYNGDLCNVEDCKEPHLIYVYCYKPFIKNPIDIFKVEIVGELYDTNEIINEDDIDDF